MAQIDEIYNALNETNKWWKGELKIDYKPREIFSTLNKYFTTKQMMILVGLRRTGKTTLMLKIVNDYLNVFTPQNILYFSFDNFKDTKIMEVINAYSALMKKDLGKERYLILFDEIQKINGWEEQIKRVYDNNPNFKIILSGSESLFIRKKARESLAGRFFEFRIKPLNFREFIQFKDIKIDRASNLTLYKNELLRLFSEFILCNGFPELVFADKEITKKYIQENIIEKIIYRDIPQIFPVKDITVLENVLRVILSNPGQVINYESLAKDLNVSRQTISTYINYLEKSFLIKRLYNFSKNIRKTERKLKKYYPTILAPDIAEKIGFGKIFETVIILQADAEYFWRDTYKNEVDMIIIKDAITKDAIIPIEIKLSKIETKPLSIFMRQFNIKKALIISYNNEQVIKIDKTEIIVTPFYKYLLTKI